MAKDAKGVFFSPGIPGLATKIGETSVFTPYAANLLSAREARRAKQRLAAQQLAYKQLKPLDFGRFHIGIGQDFLTKTIDDYSKGLLSPNQLQERAITYKALSDASKGIEKYYDASIKQFNSDPYLNKDEATKRLNQYIFGRVNSPEDIITVAQETKDPFEIVLSSGDVSSLYDVPKVTKDIIDEQFDPNKYEFTEQGKWERLKPGLIGRTDEIVSRKLHIFADVDNDGNVVVKSPDDLVSSGVVDVFISNPIVRASIEERLAEKGKTEPTVNDYAVELQSLLNPYVSGEVKQIERTQTARYHVPGRGGRGGSGTSTKEAVSAFADKLQAIYDIGVAGDEQRYDKITGATATIGRGENVFEFKYAPVFIGSKLEEGGKQLLGVGLYDERGDGKSKRLMLVLSNPSSGQNELVPFSVHQLQKYLSDKEFSALIDVLNKRGKMIGGDFVPNPSLKFK